jgi:hypothetical protein
MELPLLGTHGGDQKKSKMDKVMDTLQVRKGSKRQPKGM